MDCNTIATLQYKPNNCWSFGARNLAWNMMNNVYMSLIPPKAVFLQSLVASTFFPYYLLAF